MKPTNPESTPVGGAERSEDPQTGVGRPTPNKPSPKVSSKPKRRQFSPEYKARIVEQAEKLPHGQQAALLRREGLYSSQISEWRRLYQKGGLDAFKSPKRGPAPDPDLKFKKQAERLERENARLRERLRQAEIIIDIQKKVAEMLEAQDNEKPS